MLRIIATILLGSLLASCASDRSVVRDRQAAKLAWEAEERAKQKKQAEQPYAMRVNRTLLYPVRWGRAEDMAATLEPLVVSLYGPGARISVHKESNHLLIYIPSHSERTQARPGTATPAPQSRANPTNPGRRPR